MVYWETADQNPSASEVRARVRPHLAGPAEDRVLDDADRGRGQRSRLATAGLAEEVAQLKQEPGRDIGVGGAGLAAGFIELGLVDEYRLFVSPVVLGGGTPYFPPLDQRIALELVETRTFGSRVVYLRPPGAARASHRAVDSRRSAGLHVPGGARVSKREG